MSPGVTGNAVRPQCLHAGHLLKLVGIQAVRMVGLVCRKKKMRGDRSVRSDSRERGFNYVIDTKKNIPLVAVWR